MASFWERIKRQLDTNDGGATFSNPTQVKTKPLPARAPSTDNMRAISTPTRSVSSLSAITGNRATSPAFKQPSFTTPRVTAATLTQTPKVNPVVFKAIKQPQNNAQAQVNKVVNQTPTTNKGFVQQVKSDPITKLAKTVGKSIWETGDYAKSGVQLGVANAMTHMSNKNTAQAARQAADSYRKNMNQSFQQSMVPAVTHTVNRLAQTPLSPTRVLEAQKEAKIKEVNAKLDAITSQKIAEIVQGVKEGRYDRQKAADTIRQLGEARTVAGRQEESIYLDKLKDADFGLNESAGRMYAKTAGDMASTAGYFVNPVSGAALAKMPAQAAKKAIVQDLTTNTALNAAGSGASAYGQTGNVGEAFKQATVGGLVTVPMMGLGYAGGLAKRGPTVAEAADAARRVVQESIDATTSRLIAQGYDPATAQRMAMRGGYIAGPNATGFSQAKKAGQVFDGVDGKPRFEVDDSGAKVTNLDAMTLDEAIDHPELFQNYPELRDIWFNVDEKLGKNAQFDPQAGRITVGKDTNIGTIMHEVQHGVQNIERFARGTDLKNGMNAYRNSAGEAEARAVQARMDMPMSERYVKPEGETLYHGTTEKWQGDEPRFPLYTTPNKNYAQVYADSTAASSIAKSGVKQADGSKVHEFKLNPKARVLDATDPKVRKMLDEEYFGKWSMSDKFYPGKNGHLDWTEGENLAEFIAEKKLPYDAIKLDEGGGGLDPQFGVMVGDKGTSVLALNKNAISPNKPRSTFYDSLDVPKEDLIIRNGDGVAASIAKKIHPDDQTRMAQLIDYARGIKKFSDKDAYNLQLEAAHIAEHYGIPVKISKRDPVRSMADAFDKVLSARKYEGVAMSIDDPTAALKQELPRTDTSKLASGILKNEDIVRSVMNDGVFKMRLDNGRVVAFGDPATIGRIGNGLGDDVTDILPVTIGRGKSGKASTGQPRLILEDHDALIRLKQALGETVEKKQTVSERLREKWGEPTTKAHTQAPDPTPKPESPQPTVTPAQKPVAKSSLPTSIAPDAEARVFAENPMSPTNNLGQEQLYRPKTAQTSQMPQAQIQNQNLLQSSSSQKISPQVNKQEVVKPQQLVESRPSTSSISKDTIKFKAQQNKLVTDYAKMLKSVDDVSTGGQIVTINGGYGANGSTKRISEHSQFYRQTFKNKGRAPTLADWKEEAGRQLRTERGMDEFQTRYNALKDPESMYIANSKPLTGAQALTDSDIASLMKQAEKEAPITRGGAAAVTAPMKQAQKEAVLSGDLQGADRLRQQVSGIEATTKRAAPDLSKADADDIFKQFDIKDIKGRANKGERDKFMAAANEYLGSKRSGKYTATEIARDFNTKFPKLTEAQKLEIIKAADNPAYKSNDPAVNSAVKYLHDTYDSAYKHFTQDKNIQMGYQTSYYPRMYKHPQTGELLTSAEFDLLQRGSARQKGRVSDIVNTDYLVTKDPAEALTRYFSSLENSAAGKKFLQKLEAQGLVMRSSDPVRGMRPVVAEGMQESGQIFYARPETAKALDRMFGTQEASGFFEKMLEKGQGLNSFTQSFVLSGGIPETPVNAFGIMQVMKHTMAGHPLQAGKAFIQSMSRKNSDQFFLKNTRALKELANNGYDLRPNFGPEYRNMFKSITNTSRDGKFKYLAEGWDQLTNDATFKRFMPMLEVMHYKGAYDKLIKKGVSAPEASRIASERTANFFGKNTMAKEAIRSKVMSDASGAALFAPRFRESMVNFWRKNIEAFDPRGNFKNLRSGTYNDNVKFMVAAAAVYAGMDAINYSLNNQHVWENPDGKKDKLLIPNGTNDGKTLGIPYLSSIATVPRNVAMGMFNLATGNFKEAGQNAKSFASMPLKTIGEVLTNQDYFGGQIYDNDASGAQKFGQTTSYVAKSNMQPWLRQVIDAAGQNLNDETKKTLGIKEKSGAQRVSEALELPIRFYDPKYFKGGKNPAAMKDESMSVKDRLKQAFTTPAGKEMLALKNETERKAWAQQSPENAAIYKNYQSMKTALNAKDKVIDIDEKTDKLLSGMGLKDQYTSFQKKKAGFTDNGLAAWRKKEVTKDHENMYDKADSMLPKSMDRLPKNNRTIELFGEFAKKYSSAKTELEKNDLRKEFIKKSYQSTLSDNAALFFTGSTYTTAQKLAAVESGDISRKELMEAVELDNKLMKYGLSSSLAISNKFRKSLGVATYNTGGSGSGSGSGRKSKVISLLQSPTDTNKKIQAMFKAASYKQ